MINFDDPQSRIENVGIVADFVCAYMYVTPHPEDDRDSCQPRQIGSQGSTAPKYPDPRASRASVAGFSTFVLFTRRDAKKRVNLKR